MRRIIQVPVGDLMSAPALTVKPETTIDELTRLLAEHEFNGLPVVDDLRVLVGIVTQLDLFKLHLVPYPQYLPALESPWVSSVGAIMSPSVITLYPVEPAIRAMALMVDYRIRTIPVVNDAAGGRVVVGVLTRRDLMAALKTWGLYTAEVALTGGSPDRDRAAAGSGAGADRTAVTLPRDLLNSCCRAGGLRPVYLMNDGVAAATHGMGIPSASEVIQKAVGLNIPIWVWAPCAGARGVSEQTLANKKSAQLAPATKFVERNVWADKVVGFWRRPRRAPGPPPALAGRHAHWPPRQ